MGRDAILVIGGTGFLGQALCRTLLARGRAVKVIARRRLARLTEDPRLEFYASPLDSEPILVKLLPRCDTVYYLAADTTPGTSARSPGAEAERNLSPALRFLDVLQAYRHIRLVYVSSGGTVYGNPSVTPVDEGQPLAPVSFHGAGKVAIEAFLRVYSHCYTGAVSVLRPSNIYGPGQAYRDNFGLIRKLLEHQLRDMPITIWGDGSYVRDYLYIDDCIEACIRASEANADTGYKTYNVGCGQGYAINTVCDLVEEVTGRPLRRLYRQSRTSDVKRIVLDSSCIREELDWSPVTSLKEGIGYTWEWLKTHEN